MDRLDKKSDRIPVTKKTRLQLKKYCVNQELKNYDEAIVKLLFLAEKSSK